MVAAVVAAVVISAVVAEEVIVKTIIAEVVMTVVMAVFAEVTGGKFEIALLCATNIVISNGLTLLVSNSFI